MKRIVIPKDSILCDSCNKTIAEQDFIAICDAEWYENWLYCDKCYKRFVNKSFYSVTGCDTKHIEKGADLSQTDLALPIILEFPE